MKSIKDQPSKITTIDVVLSMAETRPKSSNFYSEVFVSSRCLRVLKRKPVIRFFQFRKPAKDNRY